MGSLVDSRWVRTIGEATWDGDWHLQGGVLWFSPQPVGHDATSPWIANPTVSKLNRIRTPQRRRLLQNAPQEGLFSPMRAHCSFGDCELRDGVGKLSGPVSDSHLLLFAALFGCCDQTLNKDSLREERGIGLTRYNPSSRDAQAG